MMDGGWSNSEPVSEVIILLAPAYVPAVKGSVVFTLPTFASTYVGGYHINAAPIESRAWALLSIGNRLCLPIDSRGTGEYTAATEGESTGYR